MVEADRIMQFIDIRKVTLYEIAAFDVLARKEDLCAIGAGLIARLVFLQILLDLPFGDNQQHLNLGACVDVMHRIAFCIEGWELEGILFGIQNPQDIHTPLVCSIQKGRLNLRGLSLAGDFSSNQIIMSKYEAVMVEQQFDDCLLCRALADTNDILFF
jgi:hypothetical protein